MAIERSDEDLLIAGGAKGFGVLYERRYPLIRGYLNRRIGSRPDLVFDLVGETFAQALEHRDQFDPERGTAIVWLLGIAHNQLLDAVRRGRVADESRRRLQMERIFVEDGQLAIIERDGASDLQHALQELPSSQRNAVERRILEEKPYPVIAMQLSCSEQVVRKRVSRGLAALRRIVRDGA